MIHHAWRSGGSQPRRHGQGGRNTCGVPELPGDLSSRGFTPALGSGQKFADRACGRRERDADQDAGRTRVPARAWRWRGARKVRACRGQCRERVSGRASTARVAFDGPNSVPARRTSCAFGAPSLRPPGLTHLHAGFDVVDVAPAKKRASRRLRHQPPQRNGKQEPLGRDALATSATCATHTTAMRAAGRGPRRDCGARFGVVATWQRSRSPRRSCLIQFPSIGDFGGCTSRAWCARRCRGGSRSRRSRAPFQTAPWITIPPRGGSRRGRR